MTKVTIKPTPKPAPKTIGDLQPMDTFSQCGRHYMVLSSRGVRNERHSPAQTPCIEGLPPAAPLVPGTLPLMPCVVIDHCTEAGQVHWLPAGNVAKLTTAEIVIHD